MADNFLFTPGSGATGASDDIGGVHYPRYKIIFGPDGTNSGDVSNANPFPAKITDGTNTASVRDTGSFDSLCVNIVDASGNQLTSFNDTQVVADNAAFADGTTKVFMGGYIYDDVAGTALTENDAAAARIDSKRAQIFVLEDGGTRGRYATVNSSNQLQVSCNVGTGTFATSDTATLVDDAAFIPGSTRVMMFGAQLDDTASDSVDEGDAGALRMTATRSLHVHLRDGVGDSCTDDTNNAIRTLTFGDTAHDAADSSNNVLKVGGKATSAIPTAVASNDRAHFHTDLLGRILGTHIPAAGFVWKAASYITAQTGTVLWDPTAGKKIAITHLCIGTGGTTASRVTIWLGANGDTSYTEGTDQVIFDGDLIPSASETPFVLLTLPHPIYCNTADYEVHVTTLANITVRISVGGYEF